MRIAVFGATGRLGREVLQAALDRGHAVTAHGRNPWRDAWAGVRCVTGPVESAIGDADAVLVTFGPRSPSDAPFCDAQTRRILEAMRRGNVGRILCVTGALVGDYPRNRTWCFRLLARWTRSRFRESMDDRARQESSVCSSRADWTVFKPPRLTMKPPATGVLAGPAVRVGLLSSVPRGSLARLMIREVEQGRFVRQCVFLRQARSLALRFARRPV